MSNGRGHSEWPGRGGRLHRRRHHRRRPPRTRGWRNARPQELAPATPEGGGRVHGAMPGAGASAGAGGGGGGGTQAVAQGDTPAPVTRFNRQHCPAACRAAAGPLSKASDTLSLRPRPAALSPYTPHASVPRPPPRPCPLRAPPDLARPRGMRCCWARCTGRQHRLRQSRRQQPGFLFWRFPVVGLLYFLFVRFNPRVDSCLSLTSPRVTRRQCPSGRLLRRQCRAICTIVIHTIAHN